MSFTQENRTKENNMSFTQENRTNVGKCDGCEKRCEFKVVHEERCRKGVSIGSGHTCAATIEDMYPVLGDKPINHYLDETGRLITAAVDIRNNIVEIEGKFVIARPEVRQKLREQMLEHARKASKLCDHYKTR